jgi:hypothetical protein
MTWQDGKLTSATIHSDLGEPCTVNYGGKNAANPSPLAEGWT